MYKIKALLDFITFKIAEKISFYRNVYSKMSTNPDFADCDVPYTEVKNVVDKLDDANQKAMDGSHTAIAYMHQVEREADDIFRRLVDYVNRTCNGDQAKILSSGFHTSKERNPKQIPEFSVTEGDRPGEMLLHRKSVLNSKSYIWQIYKGDFPVDESDWTVAGVTSQTSFLVVGLKSKERYWFRVAVVTAEGTGPFTSPISKISQ